MTGPVRRAADLPIIDSHQHLWDLSQFKLPWLKDDDALNRCFLPDDYAKASEGLHIVKTIYMEVDVHESQQAAEARWILDLCESNRQRPTAAVISGRPDSEAFGAYLDEFRDRGPLKGVRRVLHSAATPSGTCLKPEFLAGMRLLGDRGLSFDLCIQPTELPNVAKLIDECKHTQFILDHCGNPSLKVKNLDPWKRDLAKVAAQPNVTCKVSGFIATAEKGQWQPRDCAPIINAVLEAFGPDRVMFGGDWPVCTMGATLKEWVAAIREVVSNRPELEQRKLFHDNAARIYRLS
jgi:predicted TIM-barrel fold metal-dependent hydrolase